MTAKKSRKLASVCLSIVVLFCMTTLFSAQVFANNHKDEAFHFSFNGGIKDNTEGRPKEDDSNTYMKVTSIAKNTSFNAHVVGMWGRDKTSKQYDCSRGYNYKVSAPGTWFMRNWVYDGETRYTHAAIYAAPNYGYSFSAKGVWSPDSV